MNNFARTLHAQGELADARRLLEKVLDVRRVLGEEHPDTLLSMKNLALTLKAQGERVGARELLKETLDIQRRVLGKEHPATSISAFNLFVTLLETHEPAAARSVFTQHLAWLLERDPATLLDAQQRQVREQLAVDYSLGPAGDAE